MKSPFEAGRQAKGVKPVLLDTYIGANAGRTESPEASIGLMLAAVIIMITADGNRALTIYRYFICGMPLPHHNRLHMIQYPSYAHYTDEDTESQRGYVMAHSHRWQSWDLNPGLMICFQSLLCNRAVHMHVEGRELPLGVHVSSHAARLCSRLHLRH